MLIRTLVARWLGSDRLIRQCRYHADLRDLRADQACGFLLTNTNFVEWYRAPDSRQLVILGDMGCGKTVATAFLVDELSRRNEYQLPQPKICYYYCRDDETGKAVHIFSALILALLEQLCGLKKTFYEWYKQNQASGHLEPATNRRKLQEFLEKVLESLDRPLFIVVDGLDECDRASRSSLLKLLKTLLHKNPRLKTILASRPEEEILDQLDNTARIDLGSDARRDSVIVEHTVERRLSYLSKDVKTLVTEELSRLAQGSAIWTKMIIELIEVRGIRALGPMRLFLEEMPLPRQLSKLYDTLLLRCTSDDPENQAMASTALKLLAVTRRPLSILELAWAVALGAARKEVTTVAALAKLVDHQRLLSFIHPFITRIDFSDVKKRQVRLVHQSVKEYVNKDRTSNQPYLQGPAIRIASDQALVDQPIEHLETCILDICIKYLLLDEIGHINIFSFEQMAIDDLPQEIDLFEDYQEPVEYDLHCTWEVWEEDMIHYDPTERGFGEFFVYASSYWLEHFGAIKAKPLPSLASIESLCQAGSTRLHNWITQNCRPDCALKPRFTFDSRLYDPLSITALYGSEAMLRHMLENSEFANDKFLPQPAIGAAEQLLRWGDLARLRKLLLEGKLGHQLRNLDFFQLIIRQWLDPTRRHHNWDLAFDLIDHALDTLVQERCANELLCMAARAGCTPIIQRLMIRTQHEGKLRTELLRGARRKNELLSLRMSVHQSIGEAVLGNHVDVVEYLLEQKGIEAHLHYRNSHGENVLHLASKRCNPAMFRLLVPRFLESKHQTDNQGNTALVRVIMSSSGAQDRYESAKTLLLQGDVSENSHFGDEQRDPLRMAVRLGDLDMCGLLIGIGNVYPLSALTRGLNGQMALRDETPENKENMPAILRLLTKNVSIASLTG